jgi:phosphoribosylformimino-5-aminoimidazole carboxamide ribotide isomerase
MEIIPAIDIIGGKAVRLSQGDYQRKTEYGEPLDMALQFEDHGLRRLHLVDLDGAREKRLVNYRVLEQIATRTSLVIDAGGGLRTEEDLHVAFESGASMVTGGSIAVKDREAFLHWLERYGPDRIILGADFRDGKIAVSGWEEDTSLELRAFLEGYVEAGIRMAICTDISRDGMLEGPATDSYVTLKEAIASLYLVASGGIGRMEDLEALHEKGLDAVILGKAIYEDRVSLKNLEDFVLRTS